jgi:hypothetical protein
MNIDILLDVEKLQDPPVIKCTTRDCENCSKSVNEQYVCDSKREMNEYIRHLLGDVSFNAAKHTGDIERLRLDFDKLSESVIKLKGDICDGKRK